MPSVKAVLFDYSGTLFRLNEDDGWFAGMGLDTAQRADVMDRMTHPTAEVTHQAWAHRDLDPDLHREAYLHVLQDCGLPDEHARALYERVIDPAWWTPYPDTAAVLNGLRARGIVTAVVSNIAWDIRRSFDGLQADPDEFVLSFEVGAVKPDPRIFTAALSRLGVDAADSLMVGDSEENDGGALALGCAFALVDPLHTEDRPTGLIDALREHGVDL